MEISPVGALVCMGLVLLGLGLRAPAIIPLFASLPFGATALINLPSLGGSSPLIYTSFICLLLAAVLARRSFLQDLGRVFARYPAAFVIVGLVAYACFGAYLFPRLFAGETYALVTMRTATGAGKIVEAPLGPTGGNVTQTGYFALGALTFFAVGIILLNRRNVSKMRLAYVTWASTHAVLGVVDWMATIAGAGDLLAPIRTASYSMLTNVEHGGFARVVGGYSEASAFGGVTVACLAYAFADWKVSGSRRMLGLAACLALLLILSTSSTAYVALAIVLIPVGLTIFLSFLFGRVAKSDMVLLAAVVVGTVMVLGLYLLDSGMFEPIIKLFETTILNKADSESAVERSYWNSVSLQSFLDTYSLGIGIGSSRASSWTVALVSQLGLFGSALMVVLVITFLPSARKLRHTSEMEIVALHQGARAAALCGLVTGSIASGTADPGVMFFVNLAVVVSCRYLIRQSKAMRSLTHRQPGLASAQLSAS
jgi:O-Antigen ligase